MTQAVCVCGFFSLIVEFFYSKVEIVLHFVLFPKFNNPFPKSGKYWKSYIFKKAENKFPFILVLANGFCVVIRNIIM